MSKIDKYLGGKEQINEGDLAQEIAMKKRINKVSEMAQDAFWAVVMKEFKEAKTNNIDSYQITDFSGICERTIKSWCNLNIERPKMVYPEEGNKMVGSY